MRLTPAVRTLLCCAILEFGAVLGIPMRPEQIGELMHSLNQPKIAETNPARTNDGDPERPDRS